MAIQPEKRNENSAERICNLLEQWPVIPAIKDAVTLEAALHCENPVVFLLNAQLQDLEKTLRLLDQAGKAVFLHLDRVDGLQTKDTAVEFLQTYPLTGILSTRESVLRKAKSCGFLTVHRFFLWDSLSLEAVQEAMLHARADFIDLLPGLIPKLLRRFAQGSVPLLAGGLLESKEEVIAALEAGALAVSTTNCSLWDC